MKSEPRRAGYTGVQIMLHWIVVVLVLFQLVFGEDMGRLFGALERGRTPTSDEWLWGNLHIWFGFAVLAAVVLRLALRALGSPPPLETNPALRRAAGVTHIIFYVVLIAMPITGALAYYFDMPELGEIHEIGKPVLIVLITLHVLAALWHQFVRRDGGLMRMVVPR